MRQLYTAIMTAKNTSGAATLRGLLNSCGMYTGRAPHDSTGEYITLSGPGGGTERSMEPASTGATYDEVEVDFNIWSTSRDPDPAWRVAEQIKSVYDSNRLTVSGHTTIPIKILRNRQALRHRGGARNARPKGATAEIRRIPAAAAWARKRATGAAETTSIGSISTTKDQFRSAYTD